MILGRIKNITILVSFLLLAYQLNGQLTFTEITEIAGLDHHYLGVNEMGAGAAFFDIDGDRDDDLWVAGGLNEDKLYENDGFGQFTDISDEAGLSITGNIVTTGVISGDLDNDGDRDVVLLTHRGFTNRLLINNGDKTFTDKTVEAGIDDFVAYTLAGALGDINKDGYLDIYSAHYIENINLIYNNSGDTVVGFDHDCYVNKLYLNNGDLTFTEVAEGIGVADKGCALATVFTDYDGDLDTDIMVANDFGSWILPNALLQNNDNGVTFEDVSVPSGADIGIYGMGIAIGDYDNDMDLDYYITNLGRNVLLENNNDGTFSDQTTEKGVEDTYAYEDYLTVGWGTALIDFDNDADLDLFVTNGYVPAAPFIRNGVENPNRLFENDGAGNFFLCPQNETIASPLRGRGFACSDIDSDGDMDFLVVNVNRQASPDSIHKIQLYRNDQNLNGNWLDIKLEGLESNRDGFGSRVVLKSGNNSFLQEANGGFGTHASQHSSTIHFGLGDSDTVDSLIITWPNGHIQVVENIPTNQTIEVQEQMSTSSHQNKSAAISINAYPNPFTNSTKIEYILSKKSTIDITIADSFGKIIFTSSIGNQSAGLHHFDWINNVPGIYFLKLRTEENFSVKSLISN